MFQLPHAPPVLARRPAGTGSLAVPAQRRPGNPLSFPPRDWTPKTLDAFGEGGAIWKLNDPVNWKAGANVNPSTFDYPAQGAYRQDLVQAGIPVANSPRAGQTASRPSVEAMD
jgi:hypothetical protein